jgi:PAS domain S-box-containing protein
MSTYFQTNGRLKKTDIIKIILIYMVAGGTWILFSDTILHKITTDEKIYSLLTAAIGFSFVIATAGLLYFLINNYSNDRLKQTGIVKIILIYLISGGMWILFSDSILHAITNDASIYNYISTSTGLVFVIFTAGLLYFLINKYANAMELAEEHLLESEKRYKELADTLPQMIFEIDGEGVILFTNIASYKMFGYTQDEIKKGFSIYNTIIFEDRLRARINLNRIMMGEKHNFDEYTAIRSDGTTFPIIFYASPITTNKKTKGLRGIAIDITDRKIMEEELLKAMKKAEESDKLKSEFLAQMSHEIRTPLNVMLSHNSFLMDELNSHLNDNQKFSFNSVDTEGRRLIRTIDLILNMAELHTGTFEISISDINLCNTLDGLVREFECSAKEKNLELSYSKSCEDDAIIKSDGYIVTSVLQNLIDNAIKYTNSGKIELNIYKNEKNNYCVAIIDTGIGISPEYIDKIFLPFAQEDTGYSRKFDGIGLGLALVKKYLGLINADIKVESEKGKGSLFAICFN